MTETEKKWAERVKEWKAGGQTAKAFAHGRDFKPSTLTYWAYRLRQVARLPAASAVGDGAATQSATTPRLRMVRVRPTRMRRPSSTPEGATMVIARRGAHRGAFRVRPRASGRGPGDSRRCAMIPHGVEIFVGIEPILACVPFWGSTPARDGTATRD